MQCCKRLRYYYLFNLLQHCIETFGNKNRLGLDCKESRKMSLGLSTPPKIAKCKAGFSSKKGEKVVSHMISNVTVIFYERGFMEFFHGKEQVCQIKTGCPHIR